MRYNFACASLCSLACLFVSALSARAEAVPGIRARVISAASVELREDNTTRVARCGERFGRWTVMASHPAQRNQPAYAVLEDLQLEGGTLLYVGEQGPIAEFPKTGESSEHKQSGYLLGLTEAAVRKSKRDVLADKLLADGKDPDYARVAQVFPPTQILKSDTFDFLGGLETSEKVGFTYDGKSPSLNPAIYQSSITPVQKARRVWHGLVGGYLPIVRFVYPEATGTFTELIAYAPLRIINNNPLVQPVWFRLTRVENGLFAWSRFVDTYQPVLPHTKPDPQVFYADLLQLKSDWDSLLAPAMQISIPDERVANITKLSLVRVMMTRIGDDPKYGAFDKDYGGNQHDGFQDTFNAETTAMTAWGLHKRARRIIVNYLSKFVRDDGSILYRGLETGQLGRMLSVLAEYARVASDTQPLLAFRGRIDAITRLLLDMRHKALTLPATDPAYGMLSGWSEADSCLEADPSRYMQPYISNSTEAARGFQDLGEVWIAAAQETSNPELAQWGQSLVREAAALRGDIARSVERSILVVDGKPMLPAIAGAREPFDVAIARDRADPQFRSYRAYSEMLFSGILSPESTRMITEYRATHHDVVVGLPTVYGPSSFELGSFLAYSYGYGLIQADRVRDALLALYAGMAHQYTRGNWLAPETRRWLHGESAPYAVPAQLFAPLMTRWMLVFEELEAQRLWLAKAVPREWLEDGKVTRVNDASTRWGRVSYTLVSEVKSGTITAKLQLPPRGLAVETWLRLREPDTRPMREVTVNGKPWSRFDPARELVFLPAAAGGNIEVVVSY